MAARRGIKLKDHLVLALDIGSRFIKVAEMRLARGTISLLNVAVGPTPPGLVDNNQILDPVFLGRAVKELINQHKIRTRKVVVAISGQSSVVVRPIDLPRMTAKELADTMKFEVERHIPFAVDEVVMDYAPIIDPEELPETESNMKVLLAVAHEDLIKNYLKMLSAAGLQPTAMDVEILAAMRALVDIHESDGAYEHTVAMVNIGAGSMDISIICKGNLSFTRSVPIAGDTLTEAIADQLGRSFDEAEELKREYARIFLDGDEMQHALATPGDGAVDQAPAEAISLTSAFADFGDTPATLTTPAPAASPAPAAPVLTPTVFAMDSDLTTPVATHAANAPFLLDDDDVDDEMPVVRLALEDDADHVPTVTRAVPVFDLDGDDVDDEIPLIPIAQQEPPRAVAAAAPVFDLGASLTPAASDTAPPSASPSMQVPIFTMDDVDDDVPIPPVPIFSMDDEPAAPTPAPATGTPPATVSDVPVFSLSAEPAPALPPETPVFTLNGDSTPAAPAFTVQDEVATAPEAPVFGLSDDLGVSATPLAATPSPSAPSFDLGTAASGPVFDFSSELEEQLPSMPRPRAASTDTDVAPSMLDLSTPADTSPAPIAPVEAIAPAPMMDFSMDLGEPADTPSTPAPTVPSAPATGGGDDLLGMTATPFQASTDLDFAPAMERPDAAQSEVFQRRVFESMMPTLVELVTEIRRSLEYYSSREPDHPIERIILFGGTSRLPNLTRFINQEIGVEVVVANPIETLDVSACKQPAEYLADIAPALPVCIGLGLRDMIA